MTLSLRRIGVAAAALIASIGVGVAGAPLPAGALQGADTTTLAQHRCTATRAYSVFLLGRPTEQQKTEWADDRATGTSALTLTRPLANEDPWLEKVVTDLYQAALDRAPDAPGLDYWVGRLRAGDRVSVLGANFYGSTEFYTDPDLSGGTDEGFILELYERILGRTPSQGDLDYWVDRMNVRTNGQIAAEFFNTLESRRQRVVSMYLAILGWTPDNTSRDFWAGEITTDGDIEVAARLAASTDFATKAAAQCNPTIGTYYPLTLGTPLDPASNPAYTISNATLDAAKTCTTYNGASTWQPILLVPPPGVDGATWRTTWAGLSSRFSAAYQVCALTIPATDSQDLTRAAQYVARAVQTINTATSRTVDVVSHEVGGLTSRWALRWYPGIRTQVDDVVGIGVPNHGSVDNMYDDTSTPTPASQQARADSHFVKALNSNDETPGSASYSNIASGDDRLTVGDGERDVREHAWHLTGATNIRVQNSCPSLVLKETGVRDHAWVWAAVKDALTNSGTTSTTRLAGTSCGSNAGSDVTPSLEPSVYLNSEPPLPDYVPTADPETPPHTALSLSSTDPGAGARALTEPSGDLAVAKVCPGGVDARFAQSPTLLVPGGVHNDTGQMYNLMKSRFASSGPYPVCWLNVPDGVSGTPLALDPTKAGANLLRSPQYVVHVVRDLVATYGVDVDLIGHSRGGFDIAWAVKWWPDMQTGVDDVVIIDTPLRGSGLQRYATNALYPLMAIPAGHQSRSDARFIAALRVGDPTPGPASWTTISTWDWSGSAASRHQGYDTRQTAYRWPGASNIVIQQHCAGTAADHGQALTGDFAWAAISDALDNAGGALPSRFVPGVTCDDDWRVHYPDDPTKTTDDPPPGLTVQPNTEPALPGYVWNAP